MKRFFPYLISLQQCLCGLWIMFVLVQTFLSQTLSLLGCGLFFFVQWGLSHLSCEKSRRCEPDCSSSAFSSLLC